MDRAERRLEVARADGRGVQVLAQREHYRLAAQRLEQASLLVESQALSLAERRHDVGRVVSLEPTQLAKVARTRQDDALPEDLGAPAVARHGAAGVARVEVCESSVL